MRFLKRLFYIFASMVVVLGVMFNLNPSYRLTFHRLVQEVFDKNDIYDIYDQKVLVSKTDPAIIIFMDLELTDEKLSREWSNILVFYLLQEFIHNNLGMKVYAVFKLADARSPNFDKVKNLVLYYDSAFTKQRRPKINIAFEKSAALRKKLGVKRGSIAFVDKDLSVIKSFELPEDMVDVFKPRIFDEINQIAHTYNDKGLIEAFLPEDE